MNQALPLLAVAVLLVSGCPENGTRPDVPLEVHRIMPAGSGAASYSGFQDPVRLAVFDTETFAEAWERAFANLDPKPPVPEVDFAREFVVVASMGARATGGYRIEVVDAAAAGGSAIVVVKSSSPGKGCVVTQATSTPLDIVRIERPSKGLVPVRFDEQSVTTDCGP